MKIAVLIPAYNLNYRLIKLINELIEKGISNIILVNDGSTTSESKEVFMKIKSTTQCHILEHSVNLGKGRALKTGLNYFYLKFRNYNGVITADCDGQHNVEDIIKLSKELEINSTNSLILGTRNFGDKNIPIRSRFGNMITMLIFKILIGKNISDTQTGLRGISTDIIPYFIKTEGEEYEYETNMLINASMNSINILETKIATIYIDNNESSHFDPIKHSLKIYFVLFRFAISSFITSIFDFVVFMLVYKFINNIFYSVFISRFCASILNFNVNKNVVFNKKKLHVSNLFKYYILLLVMGGLSYTIIKYLVEVVSMNIATAKIIVETILFFASFSIQRDIVFANKKEEV